MNILLLTPGINKKYNDNYFAYDFMAKKGNNVLAITQREHINKGTGTQISSSFEVNGSFIIHRLFETWKQQKSLTARIFKYHQIKKILVEFKPEVIICEELSNMPLAVKIKKNFNLPLVLRVEFAYNQNYPYRTMGVMLKKFKNKFTGDYLPNLIGKSIWKWACRNSDAIISCFFQDLSQKQIIPKSIPFYYVPWPTFLPKVSTKPKKISHRAVFIGSFEKHKNLRELEETIPVLFKNTPIKEFYIVGTGEDLNIITNLKAKFPNNIKHFTSLSRDECLNLICSSYLSYSPATMGGWGFIGDSFAMKTPIIITHNHYGFKNGTDSIVTSPSLIVKAVNSLYNNNELYNKISLGAYQRFIKNHTAEAVGYKFTEICTKLIEK
tara:strand:- start:409 stop:1551 length:1143 start_codon:yes stop_codon:yes gene_type:complete